MDIKSLIADESITAWVEYPGDGEFEVQIKYLPRKEFRDIVQKARVRTVRQRSTTDDVDAAKLSDLVTNKLVLGWKGLTIAVLRTLMPVKSVEGASDDTEVEFSKDNLKALTDYSMDFENWLLEVAMDPRTFSSEESYENLRKLQDGSPKTD